MEDLSSATQLVMHRAQAASKDWVVTLARLGYATKGALYLIIGGLAAQAAVGAGGAIRDKEGALFTIATQSFGRLLLGVTALGLMGYMLWRLVQALGDPEGKGHDTKGLMIRVGYGISGLSYGALEYLATRIALGVGRRGGGDAKQAWTARLLAQPLGSWLVSLVGIIIIGVGLAHFYRAYTAAFMAEYAAGAMSPPQRRWAKRIGRLGLVAYGVTFCLIGGFVVQAARRADPREAKGLGEALAVLAQQPYGAWLLGIVALGLIAYGIFCGSQAVYRRVPVP